MKDAAKMKDARKQTKKKRERNGVECFRKMGREEKGRKKRERRRTRW